MIKKTGNTLTIGRLEIRASRWPWQGYGWSGYGSPTRAPLNNGARFGAGWGYKLGIAVGGSTIMVDLLFGTITFYKKPKTGENP